MKTIASVTLPHHVHAPRYDRQQLQSRIVHFGFGAFHRAHQALLTDRVLNAQGGDWGICEISLFSGDQLMSQLRAQNHLYTVLEKGADGNQVIIVGAVHECLNAKLDSLAAIIEKFCEPQVAIVSLTITEKGYCIDPATGALDTSNPRIIHDLQTPEYLTPHLYSRRSTERRRERGLTPFTVLSARTSHNGHVVKNAAPGSRKTFARTRLVDKGTPVFWGHWSTALFRLQPTNHWWKSASIWRYTIPPLAVNRLSSGRGTQVVAGRPAWEVAGVQMVK
ncbi:hypothetical protein ACNKHX_13650 [Shigella flexneri]